MFMTPLTEFEYYWEKAEFQDPVSHRVHVENYKKCIQFEDDGRGSTITKIGNIIKDKWLDMRKFFGNEEEE